MDVKINPHQPKEVLRVLKSIYNDLASLLTPSSAVITDVTATRAEVVKNVADITALHTEVTALVADEGINNTMLDNIKTFCNNLRGYLVGDNITVASTLSVGSTPENVATTAFSYQVNGTDYAKAAVAAGTAFSAADTINTGTAAGSFWGVWLVQINAAGTITTKSPAADQVYADEATAIAALPAPDADNVSVGYVTVQSNDSVAWTAQTDDLTPASDCLDSNFYSTAAGIPAAISDTVSATAGAPAAQTGSAPAAMTASAVSALETTDG